MENCVGVAETGLVWNRGSTSSKDTCSKIWGDGIDAAVNDGAAIVISHIAIFLNACTSKTWRTFSMLHFYYQSCLLLNLIDALIRLNFIKKIFFQI